MAGHGTADGSRYCYQCLSQLASDFLFCVLLLGMGQARLLEQCSNYVFKPHPIFLHVFAIKLRRSISLPPFLLDCIRLSPALKILAPNCQIQVVFGRGIVCSGAQGREESKTSLLLKTASLSAEAVSLPVDLLSILLLHIVGQKSAFVCSPFGSTAEVTELKDGFVSFLVLQKGSS